MSEGKTSRGDFFARPPSALDLRDIDSAALWTLWRALAQSPAKVRLDESYLTFAPLHVALDPLLGQYVWLVQALLEAVLAERESGVTHQGRPEPTSAEAPGPSNVKTRHAIPRPPELVWTGDAAARSCSRATREIIEDLLSDVRHEVLIAGYSFDHASDLFAPLFDALRQTPEEQTTPRIKVVLDCSREPASMQNGAFHPQALVERVVRRFLDTCWLHADGLALTPELRYWPASAERNPRGMATSSMHAKCIVVDRRKALVGSANFSNRGRDRNLEVGAIIEDPHFVAALCAEWDALWPQLAIVEGQMCAAGRSR